MTKIAELAAIEEAVAHLNAALRRCSLDLKEPKRIAFGAPEATMMSALDRAKDCAKELAGNVEVALAVARARVPAGSSH
ncbi:MAG: hypothetical protein ACR2RA_15130 [Geminicoccaceae bacterium]